MAQTQGERREFPRYDTDHSIMLTSRSLRISVRMLSVSAGGALIRLDKLSAKVFEAEDFMLELPGIGRFSATKKWRRDTDIGAGFVLTPSDRQRLSDRLAERFGKRSSFGNLGAQVSQP